ncbi:uncharacterized protein LOC111628649 [Centruroides sculpturatus]|uniref:uncharacterized protein LOC111628649 n=1 Tax=Centruroides sculpturatus TaxID=218467 RepID=UPI000C6D3E32|nr:uncharacterized protein LOC111628649 [Centruroides sculpturatus]
MDQKEIDRIHAMLNETLSEDEDDYLGDEESDAGSTVDAEEENGDNVQFDTDTSQSDDDEDDILSHDGNFYTGKDGTKWKKIKQFKSVRTRSHSIVTHLPGCRSEARNANTPLDAWQCFFPDAILQKIVDYTNINVEIIKSKYTRERDAKPTDLVEIKALLGLLYLSGVLKSSHIHTDELWNNDGTGVSIFRTTMNQQRFRFLLRMLCFDDKRDRQVRIALDKFAPVREIFELLVENCKKNFCISEYTTIDEMLWSFHGRCPFRQFMKSKPAKYGIKVFSLVDARTYYILNMEVYLGKQPDGPFSIDQTPSAIVKRLIQPISGSGRNVTYDNWFTSVPLSRELLCQHNLTTVGTIRKNKRELPVCFLITSGREEYSSLFGFGKDYATLVSYVPKKRKVVLLLSTLHQSDAIDPETGNKKKPEAITFYNATKGGVDTVDQMSGNYSVARKSQRWPLTVFYNMLNIAAINALIIVACNKNLECRPIIRRKFLKEIALGLVKPYIKRRLKTPHLCRKLKSDILELIKEPDDNPENTEKNVESPNKRKRCGKCPRNGNKTSNYCAICETPICGKHGKLTCYDCLKQA